MVKEYIEKEFFGEKQYIPVYEYSCYVSSYDDKDGWDLHKLYQASRGSIKDKRTNKLTIFLLKQDRCI